jgi:hypothetical protein
MLAIFIFSFLLVYLHQDHVLLYIVLYVLPPFKLADGYAHVYLHVITSSLPGAKN